MTDEDTSGFYKLDGALLYASNAVYGPDYVLIREDRAEYTYPVHGWYWFDSQSDAEHGLAVIDP